MGIDAHGLNFLRYVCAKAALGTTVMIGRQNVHDSVLILKVQLYFKI
jgi:hypothetical protein